MPPLRLHISYRHSQLNAIQDAALCYTEACSSSLIYLYAALITCIIVVVFPSRVLSDLAHSARMTLKQYAIALVAHVASSEGITSDCSSD
jgi:hypothetical protein